MTFERAPHRGKDDFPRVVVFVVARLSSSRLPAKQFREIGGKTILQWIIERIHQCNGIDEIVITTVANKENAPLKHFAKNNSLSCFWYVGDVDHLTNRIRCAAESHNAEICIIISGDCPLIEPGSIDRMVSCLKATPRADLVQISNENTGHLAMLEGVMVARKNAIVRGDTLSDTPELKQHFFPVFSLYPELFKEAHCLLDDDLYSLQHRFSVDTLADLYFMNRLHAQLESTNEPFDLFSVISLVHRKPELLAINGYVYQRKLVENNVVLLFIIDAGGIFGYGHLMRSLELALQFIERRGWRVDFMVDDEHAAKVITDSGIRVFHGALERAPSQSLVSALTPSFEGYTACVLDIYCRRDLPSGWRKKFPQKTNLFVLNNAGVWADEADMTVVPEVCVCSPEFCRIGGTGYLIIRRAVRYAKEKGFAKDIDILAYLQVPEHIDSMKTIANELGMNILVVDGFAEDFATLLARSKFFVSGFGYSFYEALFLQCIPVTLPLSEAHLVAAEFFYREMGLPALIIDTASKHERWPKLACLPELSVTICDGTSRIVDEISKRVGMATTCEVSFSKAFN
jgi:spore coat polysaccharide biosynthesis protein SpsF